jgi:O-antigen/teichoic acid export membrane protein
MRRTAAAALPFVLMTIATAVAYETDMLVVSHRIGEAALADYAVALKYVNLLYPAVAAAGFALWPVFVDAARKPGPVLRQSVIRWTLVFGLGGLVAAIVLDIAAPWFINLWTRGQVAPPPDLVAARVVFLFLSAVHYPASMAVLALGRRHLQATTLSLMAVTNLPVSIVLAGAIGVAGPVWASCLCFGALHALPLLVIALRRGRQGSEPAG